MGWLSKFFKGSSHRVSEGQYHDRYGDDEVWNEPFNSLVSGKYKNLNFLFLLYQTICFSLPIASLPHDLIIPFPSMVKIKFCKFDINSTKRVIVEVDGLLRCAYWPYSLVYICG